MSKKKENQFICSSMMLPEHREKLTERYREEEEEKKPLLPGEQSREEVAHNLTQSLLHRRAVEVQVLSGTEIQCLQGVVAESRPRDGILRLRTEKTVMAVRLESIVGCRLAPET